MTPMHFGKAGSGRLRSSSKSPSASNRAFKLFKGELKRPCPSRLDGLADQLKLATALIHGDAPADQYSKAVRRSEAQKGCLAAEENDGKLSVAILEGEVDVSRGCRTAVGDLTFDPQVGIFGLDLLADIVDQRANAPDGALRCQGIDLRRYGGLVIEKFGGATDCRKEPSLFKRIGFRRSRWRSLSRADFRPPRTEAGEGRRLVFAHRHTA